MTSGRTYPDGPPPSLTYGFELDPCAVLGVTPSATLEEVRDAYRSKAKKHHPDHGGEEWVFRIVARCYEIVSTARVVGHATRDAGPPPRRPPAPASRPRRRGARGRPARPARSPDRPGADR